MSSHSSHQQPEPTHPYTTTDQQKSTSSLASAASEQRKMWLEQVKRPFQKAGLPVIQEPLSSSFQQPPALPPIFQMVQRSIRRPATPYLAATTSGNTRDVDAATPIAFDPDSLWDSITPSAFLSIRAFIPPRELTPEPHTENPEYLSILNWDQPLPGSQNQPLNPSPVYPNPHDDVSSLLMEPRLEGDQEIGGQMRTLIPQPPSPLNPSQLKHMSTEFMERVQTDPGSLSFINQKTNQDTGNVI
ncbi:hypothetical protein EDD85DRAFT_958514 [Armillaria nabsnona]|nr:hypothetical protein EDD85DRAFT_958514 [Armillaria nabsnona]